MAIVKAPNVPLPKNGKIIQANSQVSLDDSSHFVITDNSGKIIINPSDFIDTPMWNVNTIADLADATLNALRPKSDKNIENRFSLPSDLFEAVDFTKMGLIEEPKDYMPTFVIGERYALKGTSCEGFEMPEKVYELVAVHDEFDGVNINSLIVKQVEGTQDKIFTLSKNDCEHIGIEYENGLQLFPKHLNWKRVKDIVPFDPHNLATTPLSDVDNTIRYIVLKISGFKDYHDGFICTPSGKLIKEEQFIDTFKVISNEPIVYDNVISWKENTPLNAVIVKPHSLLFNHGNFISSENSIYLLIDLVLKGDSVASIDGNMGAGKDFLEGFNPNEHFTISWDELGAYTIEEYEAEKARKEKARQEKIAQEEAEKKRRIEVEEKRIREQRKKKEEIISKMKAVNIKMPNIPKMVDFNVENLSDITLYADGLDIYFKSIDTSLTKLSNELSQMSRSIGINIDKRVSKNLTNNSLFDMFNL